MAKLLLFQQLLPVSALPAARPLTVLTRGIRALEGRAFWLATKRLANTPAHPVLRPCIPCHAYTPPENIPLASIAGSGTRAPPATMINALSWFSIIHQSG